MTSYISLPQFEATLDERLRLVAAKCDACDTLTYPKRPICPSCGGDAFTDQPLSGKGEIYSFTHILGATVPSEFDEEQQISGDVCVAVLQLDEGPRLIARLADVTPDALEIGLRVEARVRKLYDQEGVQRYGLKFVPLQALGVLPRRPVRTRPA